ncbi:MAG TPA: hypothetical protein VNT79_08250 [Phycisphaerae bacterium]|nr:hypothetical protein [Phycisphaerae bacterium]
MPGPAGAPSRTRLIEPKVGPLRSSRCATALLVVFAIAPPTVFAQTDASPEIDWLRYVPGDVRFYIEFHELQNFRQRMQQLGIWQTVRELTEGVEAATQPATPLPGMTSEEIISELIGRRGALFASDPADWQNGVLLAELPRPGDFHRWRNLWRGRRMDDAGPVHCYQLDGGLRMAVLDTTLLLGPADDPANLWIRAVGLMSGRPGAQLRGESEFASLFTRLRAPAPGLAYVSWKPGDPYALAGCERMLVGFSLSASDLRFEIQGHRCTDVPEAPAACDMKRALSLPGDTLAAWSGLLPQLPPTSPQDSLPAAVDASPLGLIVNLFGSMQLNAAKLLDGLGPRVVVCVSPPGGRQARGELDMPAVAVLVEAQDPRSKSEQLAPMLEFVASMARAASLPDGAFEPVPRSRRQIRGIDCSVVPLGRFLAKRFDLPFLKDVEVCWMSLGADLVVSSAFGQFQSIVRAREGRMETLASQWKRGESQADADSPPVEWAMLRGTRASLMLRNWLDYIHRRHPEALHDEWWQGWAAQRARERTRLGVALKNSPAMPDGAEVIEVEASQPAAVVLQIGDVIVSAGGRPLPTTQPAIEAARRFASRGLTRAFAVEVLRGGERISLSVPVEPLPDVELRGLQPMRALRQLITLLQGVERITYVRRGLEPRKLDAEIHIMWK